MTEPKFEVITGNPELRAGNVFDDLESLRKASKTTVQRKTVMVNVTVDKPAKDVYFRAHPTWVLDEATVIKDDENRTFFFVTPAMRTHPKLAPRIRLTTLAVISIWPLDTVQIWPVPIIGERALKSQKSARAAYELSKDQWVQIAWSETASDYVVETAEGIDHAPVWPDKTHEEILKLGFDGKIIDSEDYSYVRRLRGLLD